LRAIHFFFGLVGYKFLKASKLSIIPEKGEKISGKKLAIFILIALLSSSVCATFIAWGLQAVRLFPFSVLGLIITINNFLSVAILGPFIFAILYPRVEKWDLIWTDIMREEDISKPRPFASFLILIGGIGGLAAGLAISFGMYGTSLLAQTGAKGGDLVTIGVAPFLLLLIIGCIFS
jgi:energy-coupling factor transport system substrate-specific component